MAVLITKQDCNIGDANAWYRVEAHNLGSNGLGPDFGVAAPQSHFANFANAGNCQGAAFITTESQNSDRGLKAYLAEINNTATFSVANPSIITLNGHGYTGGEEVIIVSTTIPTGFTMHKIYYVLYIDANTFSLSDTLGGTGIRATGAGTANVIYTVRASKVKTAAELWGDGPNHRTTVYMDYDFTTPYAVDTTSSKWRVGIDLYGGTTGTVLVCASLHSATTQTIWYATWCDSLQTFSTGNDTPLIRHYVTINADTSFAAVAATETDYSTGGRYCGVIFSNPTHPAIDDVCYLKWAATPAASYTLALQGRLNWASYAGIRVGSSTARIPYAQKAIITGAGVNSPQEGFFGFGTAGGQRSPELMNIFLYGEIPAYPSAQIDGVALAGQKIVNTVETTGWTAGDTVYYGPTTAGTTTNTIASISGTQITLTNNLAGDLLDKANGGVIWNANAGYGVEVTASSAASLFPFYIGGAANLKISGCYMFYCNWVFLSTTISSTNCPPADANYEKKEIADNCVIFTYTKSNVTANIPNPKGFDMKRNYIWGGGALPYQGGLADYTSAYPCGRFVIEDNVISTLAGTGIWSTQGSFYNTKRIDITRNKFFNLVNSSSYWIFRPLGSDINFTDNQFYGNSNTVYGIFHMNTTAGIRFSGNKFDGNALVFKIAQDSFTLDFLSTNDSFGTITANTIDVGFFANAYVDMGFNSPTGNIVVDTTNYDTNIVGSRVWMQTEDDTANKDKSVLPYGNIVRCGDGLADTTVHTSGTAKFCLRFEPTVTPNSLIWKYDIPTGNIQNKEMNISIWVKLNAAAYYAGTHQKPKLTITYDQTSTVTATAAELTDWQLLSVIFTPLTTYGQIEFKLEGHTDATSTDRNFYADDISVLYPAGYKLDLGGVDLWADGLPIVPPIATVLSANDVWVASSSINYGTGTMGERVAKKISTKSQILALSK